MEENKMNVKAMEISLTEKCALAIQGEGDVLVGFSDGLDGNTARMYNFSRSPTCNLKQMVGRDMEIGDWLLQRVMLRTGEPAVALTFEDVLSGERVTTISQCFIEDFTWFMTLMANQPVKKIRAVFHKSSKGGDYIKCECVE